MTPERLLDELMLLTVGLYGQVLPNQDGAPVRMVRKGKDISFPLLRDSGGVILRA